MHINEDILDSFLFLAFFLAFSYKSCFTLMDEALLGHLESGSSTLIGFRADISQDALLLAGFDVDSVTAGVRVWH